MRRHLFCALALVLTLLAGYSEAQTNATITLQSAQVAAIANGTTTRNAMLLSDSRGFLNVEFLINVTTTGTATGTMQLYIQDSVDGGTTWDDVVSSNTFAYGASVVTQRFFVTLALIPSSIATATSTNITQGSAVSTDAMAAATARQGPIGDRLRVREKVSAISGSPVGPSYTITMVLR